MGRQTTYELQSQSWCSFCFDFKIEGFFAFWTSNTFHSFPLMFEHVTKNIYDRGHGCPEIVVYFFPVNVRKLFADKTPTVSYSCLVSLNRHILAASDIVRNDFLLIWRYIYQDSFMVVRPGINKNNIKVARKLQIYIDGKEPR